MRIAIFHNFMDNIGGAEIVTLTLARELNGDIYTTNIDRDKIAAMGFGSLLPRIFSIGRIPLNAPFRHQIALWRFRRLNLKDKYDFYIISGDWALSGAVNNKPNLWYVHSPLNELWEFKNYIKKELLSLWQRPLYDLWVWLNRKLSLAYAKHVGVFACNSLNTQRRLREYYDVDADVIYPPIDTDNYLYMSHDNYWLSVNRLFKHKRVELQIEAFRKLPDQRLIIVGSYEKGAKNFENYKAEIERLKPPNVEIISWVTADKLRDLYSRSLGFITTSRDEDFGMTAVEAMASGKPVIAPNEGGYRESVADGINGVLIDDIDSDKLVTAVKQISEKVKADPACFRDINTDSARQFSVRIFVDKINNLIIR